MKDDESGRQRLDYSTVDEKISVIEWLWQGWLPKGQLTLLAGRPGAGKTAVAITLADILISGRPWPDGSTDAPVAPFLEWFNTESTEAVTINRFQRHEIPLDRLCTPQRKIFEPLDFRREEDKCFFRDEIIAAAKDGCPLLIIDTFGGLFRGEENAAKEAGPFMQWLQGLAQRTGMAVLLLHHLRKKSDMNISDSVTLDRVRGSSAITANARLVWVIEGDQETGLKLRVEKSNLSEPPDPLGFQIEEGGALFTGPALDTSDLAPRTAAKEFLERILNEKPMPALNILKSAKESGIGERTLNKAKKELKITSKRRGGTWFWVKAKE